MCRVHLPRGPPAPRLSTPPSFGKREGTPVLPQSGPSAATDSRKGSASPQAVLLNSRSRPQALWRTAHVRRLASRRQDPASGVFERDRPGAPTTGRKTRHREFCFHGSGFPRAPTPGSRCSLNLRRATQPGLGRSARKGRTRLCMGVRLQTCPYPHPASDLPMPGKVVGLSSE